MKINVKKDYFIKMTNCRANRNLLVAVVSVVVVVVTTTVTGLHWRE